MDRDFQQHLEAERAKRRDQDRDDFHNELAGRDVGRQKRFLPGKTQSGHTKSKQEKHIENFTHLAVMMQNAEYAALYDETVTMVHDHASQAETEIEAAQSALSATGRKLEEVTDNAAKLYPNGEPVFMDEDGNAVRADGTPLSPEEAASVVWPDDVPTYEDYLKAKQDYFEAQTQLDAWLSYQLYLADVQIRLNDQDNPLSPKELKNIQRDIEERTPSFSESEVAPKQPENQADLQSTVSKPF